MTTSLPPTLPPTCLRALSHALSDAESHLKGPPSFMDKLAHTLIDVLTFGTFGLFRSFIESVERVPQAQAQVPQQQAIHSYAPPSFTAFNSQLTIIQAAQKQHSIN